MAVIKSTTAPMAPEHTDRKATILIKVTQGRALMVEFDRELIREAKAIVALAFRNGPIEDVHAGMTCPTCAGDDAYSHITAAEMQKIMNAAVSKVFRLLWLRDHEPSGYQAEIRRGDPHTQRS